MGTSTGLREAVTGQPAPVEQPAPTPEPLDDEVRKQVYILGLALEHAHTKLEPRYPGWAHIIATIYEMFDSIMEPPPE